MLEMEVNGTYGTGTKATMFVYQNRNFGYWYCVEGGSNVNYTNDDAILDDGVDIELLQDEDVFEVMGGVHSLEELIQWVDEE